LFFSQLNPFVRGLRPFTGFSDSLLRLIPQKLTSLIQAFPQFLTGFTAGFRRQQQGGCRSDHSADHRTEKKFAAFGHRIISFILYFTRLPFFLTGLSKRHFRKRSIPELTRAVTFPSRSF